MKQYVCFFSVFPPGQTVVRKLSVKIREIPKQKLKHLVLDIAIDSCFVFFSRKLNCYRQVIPYLLASNYCILFSFFFE